MLQSIITKAPLERQPGVWSACGIRPCSATPAAATPVRGPFHLHGHAHSCCCCQRTPIMYGLHAPHTPTLKRWQLLQRRLMDAGHGELLLPAAAPNPPKLQRCHTSSALGVSMGRLRWAGTLIMCVKELQLPGAASGRAWLGAHPMAAGTGEGRLGLTSGMGSPIHQRLAQPPNGPKGGTTLVRDIRGVPLGRRPSPIPAQPATVGCSVAQGALAPVLGWQGHPSPCTSRHTSKASLRLRLGGVSMYE